MEKTQLTTREREEFDTDKSSTSIDSEKLRLSSHTFQQILGAITSSPISNSHPFCFSSPEVKHGQSKCHCSVCIYTAQETFDTSFGGKQDNEDLKLKNAYETLLEKHKKILKENAELKSLNKGLKQDKMQLAKSLKNSQQQLRVFLKSTNSTNKQENINCNAEFVDELMMLKNQAEQRLKFCYEKLEQYIFKMKDQESSIEDLQFKLQFTINKYDAMVNEAQFKRFSNSNYQNQLNKTDGNIRTAQEPYFIEKRQTKNRNGKYHRRTESCNPEKFLADLSSVDNHFMDHDLHEHNTILNLSHHDILVSQMIRNL